jgi:hypothetical protein
MMGEYDFAGKWLRNSFFSLLLVALLGTILRYKIAFPLPYIDQRNLLHGHSHFAFSGWITQALMALIISRLPSFLPNYDIKKFRLPLWVNLVSAYGMLLSFPFEGYGPVSIFFSNLQILGTVIFMIRLWKAINTCSVQSVSLKWYKAASFFNVFSALGAFSLAYMLATRHLNQQVYLGSVYFFLHFQYNGWFSFVILGLLSEMLEQQGIDKSKLNRLYYGFLIACIPAYGLSIMWVKMGPVIYSLVVLAAIIQFMTTIKLLQYAISVQLFKKIKDGFAGKILVLSLFAFVIKILLQLGSTIPSLSKLAFGFRPIVIGYLHLVLLGFASLFILGYSAMSRFIAHNSIARSGILIFIIGVIANELMLCIEGLAAIKYHSIPAVNTMLFLIALIMFSGLLIFNLKNKKAFGQDS